MKKQHAYDLFILILIIIILFFIEIPYLNTLLGFLIIIAYSYKSQGLKSSLGFSSQKNTIKLLVTAVCLAIGIVLINYFVLLSPIERLTGQKLQLGIFSQLTGNLNLYISSIIIGWLVGGFFEEVIFRGFMISILMNILGKKIGVLIGIIFSSFIFGYLHNYQGINGQILTGLVGAILATTYVFSKKNLWLNILTHGLLNTISLTLLYFGTIN